jgi:ribosomal protein L28
VVWRIALRMAAGPSAFGVCAIAAARSGSQDATWRTWPPESEKPQIASLVGSTPGRLRVNAMAARQSASCPPTRTTRRGRPPLSPRWR